MAHNHAAVLLATLLAGCATPQERVRTVRVDARGQLRMAAWARTEDAYRARLRELRSRAGRMGAARPRVWRPRATDPGGDAARWSRASQVDRLAVRPMW